MLAREYLIPDARRLDRILGNTGITDPTRDRIIVAGDVGAPDGVLVYREAAYIHELECGTGFRARLRADALANYAIGEARRKGLMNAIFQVAEKNRKMQRWAESIGAVKQTDSGDLLYLLTL